MTAAATVFIDFWSEKLHSRKAGQISAVFLITNMGTSFQGTVSPLMTAVSHFPILSLFTGEIIYMSVSLCFEPDPPSKTLPYS